MSHWETNADAWTATVRERRIESRRVATDRAIVAAVMELSPEHVLDVGCGEGWLCRALGGGGIRCTGVDGSAKLIEAARAADPNGVYHVLDYTELARLSRQQELGSFDVGICNFSLLDEDVRTILESVRAVLRPGGRLLIQTVHPWTASETAEYVDGWRTEEFSWCEHVFPATMPWYFRTLESWVGNVRAAGFVMDAVTEPRHPESGRPLSILLRAITA